ncbi:hypothetical protein [Modestobacter excelsi]|uniref:hypothetical protein n=1 Tax=Modestobacter excelsi TaxID=2213161 RepID=UPI001C20D80C|nr:hypothetical protein [Modestobacter excelsi]
MVDGGLSGVIDFGGLHVDAPACDLQLARNLFPNYRMEKHAGRPEELAMHLRQRELTVLRPDCFSRSWSAETAMGGGREKTGTSPSTTPSGSPSGRATTRRPWLAHGSGPARMFP